jgi:2-methylisocitrate lyase-like PEP mutase family enzyme
MKFIKSLLVGAVGIALTATSLTSIANAWEPTKPVDFIIMAGKGGGADKMARLMQAIVEEENLSNRPLVPTNKSGGSGAEALVAAKNAKESNDFIIIGRTEALIADLGVDEALERATAYEKAGADIIFVHSRKKDPDEIFEFYKRWKGKAPIMAVPTAFPTVTLDELKSRGVGMVVFAHQTTLAAFAAISDVVKQMSKIKSLDDLETKLASMDDLFKLQGMHKIREHEYFIEEEVKKMDLD